MITNKEIKLHLSGIVRESIVDGPGLRLALFAQGCPHNCKGCHNPETHPYEGGAVYTVSQILDMAAANPLLDGLTLSGGEPFCQAAAFGQLAKEAKARGLTVWTYTGYTWEELTATANNDTALLLQNTDILVDGKYEDGKKDYTLRFRGSGNQRIIDAAKSLASGRICIKKF